MFLSDQSSVFSIPFRHLWSPSFGGELEALNQRPCGIDHFVGDDANQLLRALIPAGTSVSSPLQLMETSHVWPLVLYGPSGTGKTSLALSLVGELSTDDKFSLMSGADFDRRFRSSLATDAVEEFRSRIVNSHCLLIDGVQQLVDKLVVQQELVQTIDLLISERRPIILTMDLSPLLSNGLIPQLVSRLTGGLCIPVQEPGTAARSVIIQDFCRLHGLCLSQESVNWLVKRLSCSVPKIAHFFGQLKAALRAENAAENNTESSQEIEHSFISRLFQRPADDQERIAKSIVQTVASEFKLKPADLFSDSRKQSTVFARSVAVYLLRKLIGLSFLKIGIVLGNRDHSTIMHAYRKIERLLSMKSVTSKDIAERNKIHLLEQRLTNTLAGDISVV